MDRDAPERELFVPWNSLSATRDIGVVKRFRKLRDTWADKQPPAKKLQEQMLKVFDCLTNNEQLAIITNDFQFLLDLTEILLPVWFLNIGSTAKDIIALDLPEYASATTENDIRNALRKSSLLCVRDLQGVRQQHRNIASLLEDSLRYRRRAHLPTLLLWSHYGEIRKNNSLLTRFMLSIPENIAAEVEAHVRVCCVVNNKAVRKQTVEEL